MKFWKWIATFWLFDQLFGHDKHNDDNPPRSGGISSFGSSSYDPEDDCDCSAGGYNYRSGGNSSSSNWHSGHYHDDLDDYHDDLDDYRDYDSGGYGLGGYNDDVNMDFDMLDDDDFL